MFTDTKPFRIAVLVGVVVVSLVAVTVMGVWPVAWFDLGLGFISLLVWRLNREPATTIDVPLGTFEAWERAHPNPATPTAWVPDDSPKRPYGGRLNKGY